MGQDRGAVPNLTFRGSFLVHTLQKKKKPEGVATGNKRVIFTEIDRDLATLVSFFYYYFYVVVVLFCSLRRFLIFFSKKIVLVLVKKSNAMLFNLLQLKTLVGRDEHGVCYNYTCFRRYF